MKCVMYFHSINSIGGVESFLYYLSKKFDFEFYYKVGDPTQIKRLSKNILVKKYKGEHIKCDKFFVNYNPDIINNVDAKEYIMMVHCDYSKTNFAPITNPKFTKYIGVSKHVCDVFTRMTGIPCELCYNPVYIDIPKVKKKKDKVHLIYAGRLTAEKGGWRIDKIRELMNKSGIDWDLTIYSNRPPKMKYSNVFIKEPKLDLTKEIAESTFMLVTSEAEAFCLSGVESLMLGTPLICTDLPVFKELGINSSNAIIINFDVTNFNPKDTLKEFNFTYKPPKDNWEKYLPTTKTYKPFNVKVKVLKTKLWLIEENLHLVKNDIIELPIDRANELEAKELVDIL